MYLKLKAVNPNRKAEFKSQKSKVKNDLRWLCYLLRAVMGWSKR
ncbi:hypothetical protein NSP_45200 [Nodularia spumigena CCY9414]|nr:hypothetical protein NSP_45200 [Nodularia spumigena CCY9414]